MNYKAIVEGLLFVVGDEGITVEELRKILQDKADKNLPRYKYPCR